MSMLALMETKRIKRYVKRVEEQCSDIIVKKSEQRDQMHLFQV